MRKKLLTVAIATMMTLTMGITALAYTPVIGWKSDNLGWHYDKTGYGEFAHDEWLWIDGNNDGISECYNFDSTSFMRTNTTTPDGYTVNESGAWTVDGVVQTQSTKSENQTQTTSQLSSELPNVAGAYTGTYDGKQIQAVFEQDGDTIWAEIDYFLKDNLPPYKGNGLFENDFYSFQFAENSSLVFKDLTSGESVYFVKH